MVPSALAYRFCWQTAGTRAPMARVAVLARERPPPDGQCQVGRCDTRPGMIRRQRQPAGPPIEGAVMTTRTVQLLNGAARDGPSAPCGVTAR